MDDNHENQKQKFADTAKKHITRKEKFSQWIKRYWLIVLIILIVGGIYSYHHWYLPYRHAQIAAENLKKGFVVVDSFDCPKDHSIKAHLGSMIYHLRGDPYYNRTNAANGYCFDNPNHAKEQGFRESYSR